MNVLYKKFLPKAKMLAEQLGKMDFDALPISDYNKKYIGNIKPAISYYTKIYAYCLAEGLSHLPCPFSEITLVDYGGGSGFLSILAKKIGINHVIYVDLNPDSVETVSQIKAQTGLGPDVILHGDSKCLSEWCKRHDLKPQLLVATDLIEHIYDLQVFFDDLIEIHDLMTMVFSTASTPFNPYVKRKLRKMMNGCETGNLENPNYSTLRQQFIKHHYPHFTEQQVDEWTEKTRGLIYDDMKDVIDGKSCVEIDHHNTCDPQTGNWVERILPIGDYKKILSHHCYDLSLKKGFYNIHRNNIILSFLFNNLNMIIRLTGRLGFFLAPFIVLICKRK